MSIAIRELWLEIEQYASGYPGPNDDPERDFCNVTVTVTDGSVIALNVWTFGYLEWLRTHDESGEALSTPRDGLLPPDLLVSRLERSVVERAVTEVLSHGVPPQWHNASPAS